MSIIQVKQKTTCVIGKLIDTLVLLSANAMTGTKKLSDKYMYK